MRSSDLPQTLPQAKERRRLPRQRVNALVYLTVKPDNGGFLLDLSESGMRISVANPLIISSQIQFSIRLNDRVPIEGSGHVSWLSESSRSAGVRFVYLSDYSRERLRKWLGVKPLPVERGEAQQSPTRQDLAATAGHEDGHVMRPEEGNSSVALTNELGAVTTADNGETLEQLLPLTRPQGPPSSSILFGPPPPRPGAMSSEESPKVPDIPERGVERHVHDSPLFFLPRRPDPKDVLLAGYTEPLRPFPFEEETATRESPEEERITSRSAILSGSRSPEYDEAKKRQFRRILLGAVVCGLLIALGVAIHNHPGMFAGFQRLAATMQLQPLSELATAKEPGFRRVVRDVTTPTVSSRKKRGDRPVRNATIFYTPRQEAAGFPVELTAPSPQGSVPIIASHDPAFTETSRTVSGGGSAASPSDATQHTTKPTISESPSVSSLTLEGTMGALRNDGALVEEGAPVSTPLNLDNAALAPGPIVVEAVVGKDGGVRDVQLISSPASRLTAAVVEAVKQWRYRPFYENGEPVEFTTRITFDFSGPRGKP